MLKPISLAMFSRVSTICIIFLSIIAILSCGRKTVGLGSTGKTSFTVNGWITTGDQTSLLQKSTAPLPFTNSSDTNPTIIVDTSQTYQTIDGFGYSLTGGSAYVINKLPAAQKAKLLDELFGTAGNAIGISYLRVSIGASDLDEKVFSYDDMPPGKTDVELQHFSLKPDEEHLIPILQQILAINPAIKIIGAPWSPPTWMKTNDSTKGGSLLPQYYDAYARYFVKYIQQMKVRGITIDAITPQNEPLHPGNNPSLLMLAEQQRDFIKNNLGPAFKAAGISTKIVCYDHNCNRPDYPLTVLADPVARSYTDGSAFHLYEGDISALSKVHDAYPDKNLYFTEQWTSGKGNFAEDLKWHTKNVIIGTVRNWGRIALEWNLANDPQFNPHTPGGCTECQGAVTIGTDVKRNVAYYIIAHASKFVPAGSVRIGSNIAGSFYNAAFKTPTGSKVLIVVNDGNSPAFNIQFNERRVTGLLPPGAVGTYSWD